MNAQEICDAVFSPKRARNPRSQAYKTGCLHALQHRLDDKPMGRMPYDLGTAEADAYFAGCDEGRLLATMIARGEYTP